MNRRKLFVLVGFLAVVVTSGIAWPEEKTLYRKASPYATLVVTEDEGGLRTLRFGDDPDAQSIVKVGDPDHVEFEYIQAMFVTLTMVKEPQRVLIVGLGGGSLPSLLRKHYPRMTIDVVDIDRDVVEVAKKFFGFHEDAAMQVHIGDGRHFIEKCKQPYDIIFLDAYGPENIPYDLATKEFLLAVPVPWCRTGSWRATSGHSRVTRSTTLCCGPTRRRSTTCTSSTPRTAITKSSWPCPQRGHRSCRFGTAGLAALKGGEAPLRRGRIRDRGFSPRGQERSRRAGAPGQRQRSKGVFISLKLPPTFVISL